MGWLESLLAPENFLALLGVVVTVGVLSYERLIPGRKRIGFRVQMDTVIDDGDHHDQHGDQDDGPLYQRLSLLEDAPDLAGASLVLLRIENDGFRSIDADDYITAPEHSHGLTVTFPGRTVRDVAVTEPSHPTLLRYLPRVGTLERPGLHWSGPEISLPRVPLNRGDHFKLLVLLTGPGGGREPQVVGRVREGRIRNNERFRRPNNRMLGLIAGLCLLVVAQPFAFQILRDQPLPGGCARGDLTVVGSTAFQPVMRDLDNAYRTKCRQAPHISVEATGSGAGISRLLDEGAASKGRFAPYLALSDGPAQTGGAGLKEHLVAVSVFTLVVNTDVPVSSLPLRDLQRLYTGEVTDWGRLHPAPSGRAGPDLQVTLVGRDYASGTRNVFENRLLGGNTEPSPTSSADDCARRTKRFNHTDITRCEQSSTDKLLRTVAATPGAIGYAELNNARQYARLGHLKLLGLDGETASVPSVRERAYPFWEPEYAYTFGAPPDNSLTSDFLDYLASDTGQNVMERHGHVPCAAPENQQVCQEAGRDR